MIDDEVRGTEVMGDTSTSDASQVMSNQFFTQFSQS